MKRKTVFLTFFLAVTCIAFAAIFSLGERKTAAQNSTFFGPKRVQAIAFAVSGNVGNFAAVPKRDQNITTEPILSFDGIKNFDNALIHGLWFLPSDTNGDVGPNHYFQTVNSLFQVFDKSGNALTPPTKYSTLFAPLQTTCANRNDGSPVVLYDSLADRWIISTYCTAFVPFRQMIAVSRTGNPLGDYNLYEFPTPNVKQNDYAKLGVWSNSYLLSTDEFFGGDYAGSGAYAFNKQKMLKGDPHAEYIYFSIPTTFTTRRGGILPADVDGLTPPQTDNGIFAGYSATEYGEARDALRLYDLHADFQNPDNSTFAERPESPITVQAFDPTSPADRMDISQPAPGEKLDSQSDRLMYRLAYRNFGSHESLVVNQTVRMTSAAETYRAGVRVYRLQNLSGGFLEESEATIGNSITSKFMGSAAEDSAGNVAVGYSESNEEKAPAIKYALLNGSNFTEHSLTDGTGVQRAFGFRWGNYTGMSVDPIDGCTFWYTNQYFSLESQNQSEFAWLTRIGAFRHPNCVPQTSARARVGVRDAATNLPISNADVKFTLSKANYERVTLSDGLTESVYLPVGTYTIEVKKAGFAPFATTVSLTASQTDTLIETLLTPVADVSVDNILFASESCALNGAVTPGEQITANVTFKNNGQTASQPRTRIALLSAGGVVSNFGAQNLRRLSPGESTILTFAFTVDQNLSCGEKPTLNFQITQPGAADILLRYQLNGANRKTVFFEKFDSSSAVPANWTSTFTGNQPPWTISQNRRISLPNAAFAQETLQVGTSEFTSPPINISSADAELTFANWYTLETTFLRNRLYDGAVLDIKIGSADWQDIIAAGGAFRFGEYDGIIDSCCTNPLGGRAGWSGRSGVFETAEWINARLKLPATAAGNQIRLRWRLGTDIGGFREGFYIDDVRVTDGFDCRCGVQTRAPFDFDGDGKTDIGVFRGSDLPTDQDFRITSSENQQTITSTLGANGDRAAVADYDGDGKADIAVFTPANGTWKILQSATNTVRSEFFGIAEDVLSPDDFDGDSKADIAVFRPSNGVWYWLQSSDGAFRAFQFGTNGDKPVSGDFDGDGKADIAVYRPADGVWHIWRSATNNYSGRAIRRAD